MDPAARHKEVFKDFGAYWDEHDGEGAWHFPRPAKAVEKDLTRALLHVRYGELLPAEAFARSLAESLATVIHARGSQARKIGRSEATGESVWLGYEEDALKAVTMAGRATAAGAAKREMVQRMMAAFTGRDESWQDYRARRLAETEDTPAGTLAWRPDEAEDAPADTLWREYDAQVQDRRIDSATQPEAYAEGISYMREMARNEEPSERVIGIVKGLASLKYLSGVAPAAVNLTALCTTVPAALSGYGHIALQRGPTLLGRGIDRYARHYLHRKFGKGPGLTGDDAWLFGEISRRGWDEQQMNREAIQVLQNWGEQSLAWVTEKALLPFAVTERFNRAATIAAAYWGLVEKHGGELTASDRARLLEQAKEISDKAHAVYGKANLPSWARGSGWGAQLARSWYMYKTFSHNFLAVLYELGVEKREAGAVMTLMLAPAVIAGLGALPAKDLLKQIAAALLEAIPGYEPPDDIEEAIYDAAERAFGGAGERAARAGIAGLAGVDLRGSLAIGVTDVPTSIGDLLGAPWSVMRDVAGGVADLARGDLLKGAEKLLPRFAAGPVKAVRESTQGVTQANNQPVYHGNQRLRAGMIDAAIGAAGFSPARLAVVREEQWNERQVEARYDQARSDVYRRVRAFYLQDPYARDPQEWAEVLELVRDYNARVQRSGSDTVPFITDDVLRRIATQAQRPARRERWRREPEAGRRDVQVVPERLAAQAPTRLGVPHQERRGRVRRSGRPARASG